MENKKLKPLIKDNVGEVLREEILSISQYLISDQSNLEYEQWNEFSLQQAMRGLENDNIPEYTEEDIL